MLNRRKIILWLLTLVTAISLTIWIIFLIRKALEPILGLTSALYVALASVIFLVLISFMGTLSSTITYDNILQNVNRAQIYVLIKNNPGIHFSELIKTLELSKGQASWHILYLERFELIKRVKTTQYLMFYPNDGTFDEHTNSITHTIIFKSDTREKIYQYITSDPGTTQSKLSKELEMTQSTIAYHLIILSQEKMIRVEQKGRRRYYYPDN
jgi:predicted transcriptional regulator